MAIYNVNDVYSLPMVIIKSATSKLFILVFTFIFNNLNQSSKKIKKKIRKSWERKTVTTDTGNTGILIHKLL